MAGRESRITIGDYFTLQRGTTYKSRLLGFPGPLLLGLATIRRNGGFRRDSLQTYGGDSPEKLLVQPGDLYLSLKDVTQSADLLGAVARLPYDQPAGRLTQDTVKLVPRSPDVPSDYLHWLLRTPQYRNYCRSHATGTTNLGLTRDDFLAFPAVEPTRAQLCLVDTLTALDDKIELNRRMSETLEAMARVLFKSWFVDFDPVRAKVEGRAPNLPEPLAKLFPASLVDSELGEVPSGWTVGPLGQFFALGLGGVWGEETNSGRADVAIRCLRGVDCHELAEGRIPDVPVRWVSPRQAADRHLTDGTILLEGSGSFCGRSMLWKQGYGYLLGGPVGYSNFCKRLNPVCATGQATICWMHMRQAYRDGMLQRFRTGTAFPNFDVHGALSNLNVILPPAELAEVYRNFRNLSQRLDLMAESRTLMRLRDALLPKLTSGEIRIRDTGGLVGLRDTTAPPAQARQHSASSRQPSPDTP